MKTSCNILTECVFRVKGFPCGGFSGDRYETPSRNGSHRGLLAELQETVQGCYAWGIQALEEEKRQLSSNYSSPYFPCLMLQSMTSVKASQYRQRIQGLHCYPSRKHGPCYAMHNLNLSVPVTPCICPVKAK